ncbi:hypothetical protein [Caulobacter segnis]
MSQQEALVAYSEIDAVIREWSERHSRALNTEFGGQERRFCYVSGGPEECFQVSIEPPESGRVLVNAWSVETIDDAELHESWTVEIRDLPQSLEVALKQVSAWNARPKGPATWGTSAMGRK